jgi:hypothetical protein
MDEIKKILEDSNAMLEKSISTSDIGDTVGANNLLAARDLDPIITNLADRNIPFYDAVKKEDGFGAGFNFNLTESLFDQAQNPRDAFYSDGGLPQSQQTSYGSQYVAYKSVGYQGSVTGLAQAVGESIVNLYATEVEKSSRRTVQALEWLAFWSDTTTANSSGLTGFAGLNSMITTNVIDASGAVISKALIDRAAVRIQSQGGMATHMFCSLRVAADVNNLYNGNERVIVNAGDRQSLTLGNRVADVSTVAGYFTIVPDFFINPGNTYPLNNGVSSTPLGATTSTIFILNMNYITYKFLRRLTLEPLGKTADKIDFFTRAYCALKLTAEPWCAKIINVKDNTIT